MRLENRTCLRLPRSEVEKENPRTLPRQAGARPPVPAQVPGPRVGAACAPWRPVRPGRARAGRQCDRGPRPAPGPLPGFPRPAGSPAPGPSLPSRSPAPPRRPAPPGDRPRPRPAAVTHRPPPSRPAPRGHSPAGGARRSGGAPGRGSSRGSPRASPSCRARAVRTPRRRRRERAPSRARRAPRPPSLPPALLSSLLPAPIPTFPRSPPLGLLLSLPSSPPSPAGPRSWGSGRGGTRRLAEGRSDAGRDRDGQSVRRWTRRTRTRQSPSPGETARQDTAKSKTEHRSRTDAEGKVAIGPEGIRNATESCRGLSQAPPPQDSI